MVENLKASVEGSQNLTGFTFFPSTPFIKKNLGRSFRLIAYSVPFADNELILFLRILARGSNEYENFLANWDDDTPGITRQFQPYDSAQLQRIYAQLTSISPPTQPPEPSAEERAWLYEVFRKTAPEDELLVLETEEWVRKMRAPENRDFLALYHQMIEQLGTDKLRAATSNTGMVTHWEDNGRLGVVYLYRPDLHRLLLLEPIRQSDDVNAVLAEHGKRLASTGGEQQDLSRIAARSYPYLMILDQTAWLAIQKDEEANLALSPEEAELLESIHRAGVEGELGYPLFINGRAGSGKSTMLQYLAADYVDFALRRNAAPLPLYMTCSRDLLERARETVRGLLMAHHERLLEGAHSAADVDRILNRSFAVFHEFLYSLLPANVQNEFPRDRYVSYAEFRRLWSNDFARRPEARQISPDLAWHTVRSYIKGIRSSNGDELAPEEFNALPRRRRSVSEETYRRIYDRVWCSWYKRLCEEELYWDDQDLAARVLQLGLARGVDCSAVFCDEAQDFTPAELDIIFQLSVFGRRSLQPEELRRVPIVFAGDPLQTINPTGFRWDAVQADFHERFCAILDPRRRARIEVSYRELRFNYRSNPGIVRFCNLIQLVRAALLGAAGISPQEAWWVDVPVQTVWFALDNAQTKQQLEKRPDLVKLVNCEEGEETDFVRADSILKDLKEETEGIYRNVLGPTRAKGLEFPAVVVYRYGEAAPTNFLRLLSGEIVLRDSEERLPYEYFLNRLYVAASRAKGQLVIVDSGRALEAFWRFATDTEMIDRLMEKAGGVEIWKDAITFLVPGREQAWSGERIDPREQAVEYATQGRRKRDPYLLRQATLAYRSAGDEHEAGKCLALAAEFEGRRKEAGDKYRELGFYEEAFRCYWEGRNWTPLCELTAREFALTSRLESQAADFMARTTSPLGTFLTGFIDAAAESDWRSDVSRDTTWREVLSRLAERLSKTIGDNAIPWVKLLEAFQSLVNAGVPIDDAHLAAIAYAAKDFNRAVEIWDRAGTTERDEYRRAKAHVDPFPTNLRWFSSLKEHRQVLQQWRQHYAELTDISKLEERVTAVVVDAALAENDLSLAATMLDLRPDRDRVVKLLSFATKGGDANITSAAAVLAARTFVRTRAWKSAIGAAEDTHFPGLAGIQLEKVRSVLGKSNGVTDVFRTVVDELAISDDLAAESAEQQAPVAEFLNRHFIGKGGPQGQAHVISPVVIGAAIERAGKIVDALQFYEDVGRQAAAEEEQKFAAERLVRNLERHAEYFLSRGDERQARQRQSRAQQLRERGRLGNAKVSDYPVVRPGVAHDGSTEWARGPFKVVLSKSHERLRIEHTERFETVTLNWKDHILLGDAKFSELDRSGDELAAWAIEGWNATIRLVNGGNTFRVVASFGKEPFEITL
jgi:hypothetical protein